MHIDPPTASGAIGDATSRAEPTVGREGLNALMARGLAHNLKNSISAILLHLSLLKQIPDLPENIKSSLQQLESEALRASTTAEDLFYIGGFKEGKRVTTLHLNEVAPRLFILLRSILKKDVQVEFKSTDQACPVDGRFCDIFDLVVNLCLQSYERVTPGGAILAEAGEITPPNDAASRESMVYIRVHVSRSQPILPHDPALAPLCKCAARLGGRAEVDATKEGGCVLTVYLPVSKLRPVGIINAATRDRGGGSETLLVIEDEVGLRRVLALSLRKLGYAVLEAGTGAEAMQAWEQNRDKIALVLADMKLPGSTKGLHLAKRMCEEKSSLQIIITSGEEVSLDECDEVLGRKIHFLVKPCGWAKLADAVRECLDSVDAPSTSGDR